MKVQESVRASFGEQRLNPAGRSSVPSPAFQNIINSYSKELTETHLQQLLEEIDSQGQKLSEQPTFQELRKYKSLVKRFMDDVTKNGVGLYHAETWDPFGGNKSLKTVQILDKKLVELTDQILSQQNDQLSILSKIGEIKGLLVNLYT
ncbi:YaaR family protein [Bacillus sp. B-jedd]|uniref:YaaR family protein n=1 Tax=Bacillus sp. B-jedd TaxID=1476857 RepID=UPI0005155B2C|nr:YaaR family protein [Bacillus sp. B-jedd]CEG25892.1 YaaR [Bacillus sp. B-jedd]